MMGATWFGVAWLLFGWTAASILDWVRAPVWVCMIALLALLVLVAVSADWVTTRKREPDRRPMGVRAYDLDGVEHVIPDEKVIRAPADLPGGVQVWNVLLPADLMVAYIETDLLPRRTILQVIGSVE